MLQTVRVQKVDEENEVIMVLKLSQKVQFLLTSAGNLRLIDTHLKMFITLFQKIIKFTGVWATIQEILAIKISKKMLTQQKFNKTFWLQTLISPEKKS